MEIASIGIHIKVADFAKSKAFYEALGFKKVFEYGPESTVKEVYRGVTYEHGGSKLEIAEGHRAVKPEVFGRKMTDSKLSLMINTDNLMAVLTACKKAHINPSVGVRHYYWGTLELVIKDPDGVVLVFIQAYDKETAEKLEADETWGKVPEIVRS